MFGDSLYPSAARNSHRCSFHLEKRLIHGLTWDEMPGKASNGAAMRKYPVVNIVN